MTMKYSLRAVALAGVCLAPLAAAAQTFDVGADAPAGESAKQYSNEIDVGARYQSSTSPIYGRYNGNDSKGFGSLGGFHLEGGDAYDSGKTLRYQATGTNLNFSPDHQGPNNALAPEAELNASIGQQGTWKAGAYYNAITYNGQNFITPYTPSGSLAPGLNANGGGNSAVTGAYYLTHPLPEFTTTAGTRRDIGGGDAKYIIGDWTVTGGLRHEHKEGTTVETLYSAGLGSGVAFPAPVNYDTDRYDVKAAYSTRKLQATLGYTFSKFQDNTAFFTAPLATFAATPTTLQYSLPPDNYAHYVNASAGYNVTPTTRVTGNFQYGIEASDGALGFGTATPGYLTGTSAANLAKNPSGNQLARVYNGNIGVTSRPLNNLDINVNYGIDSRQANDNPMTVYGNEHGDGAAALVGNIVQQSWTKQKAVVEAGYKVLPKTKLTVGYRFDDTARNGGAIESLPMGDLGWVGHSTENTAYLRVADHTIQNVNGSATYEHAVRNGNAEFAPAGHTATSFPVANAENFDSLGFYQAPRTADRVKLRADYTPSEDWVFGMNGKYETNHYRYPEDVTGTERDYNASIGPDVSYSPTKSIALHGFYTYQEIYYVNRGNGVASVGNATASTTTPQFAGNGYGWSAATTSNVHTAGVSADWKVTERLKVGVDYTFSYGDIGYNMYDGLTSTLPLAASYFNVQNLPGVNSSMHSIKLKGEYKLSDAISLLGGYGFDLYKDNDWAYGWGPLVGANSTGGSTPTAVNTATSGEYQPSYRVHSLYTAVRVKF